MRCDAGWIDFDVVGLTGDLRVTAPYWPDPFPDMLIWLEWVCNADLPAFWSIDQEGTTATFIFVPPIAAMFGAPVAGQLLYTMTSDDQMLWVSAIQIDARTMVSSFYRAFRTFVESDRYVPSQWENDAPLTYYAAEATEEEEDAALSGYNGEKLRDLRSYAVEAYLAEPSENPQLALDLQWPPRAK